MYIIRNRCQKILEKRLAQERKKYKSLIISIQNDTKLLNKISTPLKISNGFDSDEGLVLTIILIILVLYILKCRNRTQFYKNIYYIGQIVYKMVLRKVQNCRDRNF